MRHRADVGVLPLAQVPALSAMQRLTLHGGLPEGQPDEADFFAYMQRALLPMGMLMNTKCALPLL